MTKLLIPSLNRIIETDHIISADFSPAYYREAGADPDTYIPYDGKLISPKLVLVMTELVMDEASHYDGAVYGVASTSARYHFSGPVAEAIWNYLTGVATALMVFSEKVISQ